MHWRLFLLFVLALPAVLRQPLRAEPPVDWQALEEQANPLAMPAAEPEPRNVALRDHIRRVLRYYAGQMLNSRDHNPWEVMHQVVAFGVDAKVRIGSPGGKPRTAVGWLCYNHSFHGQRMLTLLNGKPIGIRDVGLEGHHGQLLAIMAQSFVPLDYPMRVGGRKFTLESLLENEKVTCRSGEELTFKLIGLSHYLPSNATWRSGDGKKWSIERLVAEEIKQPIQGAACGGTHRLMGLSYAVAQREMQGKPLTGQFHRADRFVRDYHNYTFRLQNLDGSFSTQWLEYREARPDVDRRVQTTGHILEWLVYSLDEDELDSPHLVRAVVYLTGLLERHRDRKWEIGPLAHAVRALRLYDRRRFQSRFQAPEPPDHAPAPVARHPARRETGPKTSPPRQGKVDDDQRKRPPQSATPPRLIQRILGYLAARNSVLDQAARYPASLPEQAGPALSPPNAGPE